MDQEVDSAAEWQKSRPKTRQGSLITAQIRAKDYAWVADQPQFAPLIKTSAFSLAGLRNSHTSFQNNYRLADHPEGGQTTQYKRVSVLIQRMTLLPVNDRSQ
jgi:hypothetical protein